jgi:putative NADPH-quinone reductase
MQYERARNALRAQVRLITMKRICIIQGHPTPGGGHFCHALAYAYADGATDAGHDVRTIAVAEMDFPLLRSKLDWDSGETPPAIASAQQTISWAEHLVVIHPLWVGMMPALLKGFVEQTFRPGFAMRPSATGSWTKLLTGRSARVVVTMGMPALVYRWYFGAHALKSLAQNLALIGIRPCRHTLIGTIEGMSIDKRRTWLDHLRELGRRGG